MIIESTRQGIFPAFSYLFIQKKRPIIKKRKVQMEYKNMTDSELATIMVNYINRIDHLRGLIGTYLDSVDHGCIQPIRIKELYKQLKYELRDDYNYLDLARNKQGSRIYMYYFSPSIREAFAWGFTVPVNGAVNYAMFSALSEAHYKLTKYYSLEEWGQLI